MPDNASLESQIPLGLRMAPLMQSVHAMGLKAWELQARARRFAAGAVSLCTDIPKEGSAVRLSRKLVIAARAIERGHNDTCASQSPDQFIKGISAVARQAKEARTCLQLLIQLGHVTFESARDLLLEAKGLEAIFAASRNRAMRRKRSRFRA